MPVQALNRLLRPLENGTAQTNSPLKLLLQGDRGEAAIWTSHSLRRDPLNGHARVDLAGGEGAAEVKFP
jgi:hypothetical protein